MGPPSTPRYSSSSTSPRSSRSVCHAGWSSVTRYSSSPSGSTERRLRSRRVDMTPVISPVRLRYSCDTTSLSPPPARRILLVPSSARYSSCPSAKRGLGASPAVRVSVTRLSTAKYSSSPPSKGTPSRLAAFLLAAAAMRMLFDFASTARYSSSSSAPPRDAVCTLLPRESTARYSSWSSTTPCALPRGVEDGPEVIRYSSFARGLTAVIEPCKTEVSPSRGRYSSSSAGYAVCA
mmetsp:Transcript_6535/g.16763  ORF Transcript_6535/g.16763 Transcript_6535/m.16763 type:complete len:235 (-) Transcript_6535:1540-2244(-)